MPSTANAYTRRSQFAPWDITLNNPTRDVLANLSMTTLIEKPIPVWIADDEVRWAATRTVTDLRTSKTDQETRVIRASLY